MYPLFEPSYSYMSPQTSDSISPEQFDFMFSRTGALDQYISHKCILPCPGADRHRGQSAQRDGGEEGSGLFNTGLRCPPKPVTGRYK